MLLFCLSALALIYFIFGGGGSCLVQAGLDLSVLLFKPPEWENDNHHMFCLVSESHEESIPVARDQRSWETMHTVGPLRGLF